MRRKIGVRKKMSERVDRKFLKWFGHVERASGERLNKKVYGSEEELEEIEEGLSLRDWTKSKRCAMRSHW